MASAPGQTTSGGDPVGIEGLRQRTGRTESVPEPDDKVRVLPQVGSAVASNIVPDIRHSVSFIVLRPVEAKGGLAHAHATPEQLHSPLRRKE